MAHDSSLICVDMGTTNTRVWLLSEESILAHTQVPAGVRDTAREGSSLRIRTALRDAIATVRKTQPQCRPSCVIAAGMITSALGLMEVPHVEAPAGLEDISASVRRCHFSDICEIPILLVPGIRCRPPHVCAETIGSVDVMRGEETLCLGLSRLGLLNSNGTLLNLGSHWKLIHFDSRNRIASSITTLSGELIHAAQTQTILASAVPQTRAERIETFWLQQGMNEALKSGLSRAQFCVRLLEQAIETTPEERLSYLIGAFIACDLSAFQRRGFFENTSCVLIAGSGALAGAWQHALFKQRIASDTLSQDHVENAFLMGLQAIVQLQH